MEKKAESLAIQKKLELKDELTKELATKEDIARLEGMIKSEISRLEGMIKSETAKSEGMIKSETSRLEGMMKSEISRLEGMMKSEISRLEGLIKSETLKLENKLTQLEKKFTLMIFALFFVVIFLNQNTIEFILKIINLVR
jgi:transcriptional regulator with XRE-family HTH domain